MSLVQTFLTYIIDDNHVDFKKFIGRIEARGNNQTLSLIIHVFDGATYTLEELQALQNAWTTFVPLSHIGYTTGSLSVNGERIISAGSFQLINEPG